MRDPNSESPRVLYIVGAVFLLVWFVGKFLLHKGGFNHAILITAITFFVIQFAQDSRTREYKRSLKR